MSEFFDISPLISSRIAVFPGDQPFRRDVALSFKTQHHLELSSVTTTVHLGAHADAPSHYAEDGVSIERRDPRIYIGRAQVIRVKLGPGERIFPGHIDSKKINAARVLFATDSFPDPNQWTSDFNSLSPELIESLANQGVRLVGIDTPSVDPAQAKDLTSHQMIFKRDLAILEGLVLTSVPEGLYRLVATPLRLQGLDASPVRALLFGRDYCFDE